MRYCVCKQYTAEVKPFKNSCSRISGRQIASKHENKVYPFIYNALILK